MNKLVFVTKFVLGVIIVLYCLFAFDSIMEDIAKDNPIDNAFAYRCEMELEKGDSEDYDDWINLCVNYYNRKVSADGNSEFW